MKINKNVALIYIPLAIGALLVAFIAGANIGLQRFFDMDSAAKAKLLTGELNLIREGNAQKLIKSKEIELDGEIVRAMRFQESGQTWMFPLNQNYDREEYLRTIANYRKKYPSTMSKIDFNRSNSQQLQNEMKSFQLEVAAKNKSLLEQHGK